MAGKRPLNAIVLALLALGAAAVAAHYALPRFEGGRRSLEAPEAGGTARSSASPAPAWPAAAPGTPAGASTKLPGAARARTVVRAADPTRAAILGLVLDPEGRPPAGATVRARLEMRKEWAATAPVTADGTYALRDLEEGVYAMEARAPGLRTEVLGGLTIRAGEEVRGIDFVLDRGERVLGTVLDPDGRPVERATVAARPAGPRGGPEGDPEASAQTGKDGAFEVRGLTIGKKALVATAKGYRRSAPVTVEVRAHEAARVELRLEAGTFVAGRVTYDSGGPAPNVRIEVRPEVGGAPFGRAARPDELNEGTTGGDGRYRVDGLAGRRFRVTAIPGAPGFAPASRGGISAGAEDADLVLKPGASLAGTVVHAATREPIEGATVSGGDGSARSSATSDEEGRFELGPLPAGTQTIVASAKGCGEAELKLKLRAGERKDGVVIELAEGCVVEGRVFALAGGKPLEGAVVRVILGQKDKKGARRRPNPGEEAIAEVLASNADLGEFIPPADLEKILARNTTTDSRGRFIMADLPVGEHRVYAAHADYPGAGAWAVLSEPGDRATVEIGLPEGGGIAGRVAGDDGAPRADEGVIAFSFLGRARTARTDERGEYAMKGLAPGSYFVTLGAEVRSRGSGRVNLGTAMGPGLVAKTANVEMGRVARVDFGAEPKAIVSGCVTRDGEPAKDSFLQFFPEGGVAGLRGVSTNEEGRYAVDLVPGKYIVRIESVSERLEVPLDVPEIVRDFRLPTGTIAGRVVNAATGEPLDRARVTVYKAERGEQVDTLAGMLGALAAESRAQADGTFRAGGLAPGTYTITAAADGFAAARLDGIEVPPDAEASGLELACEPGGVIRGAVLDERRDPVAGAAVWIVDVNAKDIGSGDPPRADEEGRFEIRRFAPGRYRVTVLSEAHAPWRETVDFPGGTLELAVTLVEGGTLEVSVSGPEGRPVPGAVVELRYPDGDRVITGFIDFIQPAQPAGADGRFRKNRLPPGSLKGVARFEQPGFPPAEGTFEATIVNRAEVSVRVALR